MTALFSNNKPQISSSLARGPGSKELDNRSNRLLRHFTVGASARSLPYAAAVITPVWLDELQE